jgi:hypothetical protein
MADICHCCELEPAMHGFGSLGRKCFMLWYDSGIRSVEHLREEAAACRENDFWPWGEKLMPMEMEKEIAEKCLQKEQIE